LEGSEKIKEKNCFNKIYGEMKSKGNTGFAISKVLEKTFPDFQNIFFSKPFWKIPSPQKFFSLISFFL